MNEEIEEKGISINDFFFLVKQNLLLIVIIVVLCTIAGGVYGLGFKKTTYTATVTAMVDAKSNESTTTTTSDYQLSYLLAQTFSTLITSEPILDAVANDLSEYDIKTTDVGEAISVTTNTNSLIIKISAKAKSEQLAIDLANSTFDRTIEAANKTRADGSYEYSQLGDTLKCIAYATSAEGKRGASVVIIVSFLIGLVISACVILIRYALDDTFTSKEKFEKAFNIDVLALLEQADTVGEKKK